MPVITPSGLIESVRDQINDESDFYTDAILYQWMSLAQNIIANQLGINELTATSNTVVNQREYIKPSGWVSLERVTWDLYPLKRVNLNNIDTLEGAAYGGINSYGQPCYYYEFGNKIGLSPIPDSVKEIKYYYRGNPTTIHSTVDTTVLIEKTAELTGNVYTSDAYTSLNNVKIDGVNGQDVLPDELLASIADSELIINGVIYSVNTYKESDGDIITVNSGTDGYALDFTADPRFIALRWNNDLANGGFDLTATDTIYFKYYVTETTSVPSEFALPEEFLYPIEYYLLYKMFQRDDMQSESQQYYRMWLQGLQELKDLKFSRNENLVDNCIGETEFQDWDIEED